MIELTPDKTLDLMVFKTDEIADIRCRIRQMNHGLRNIRGEDGRVRDEIVWAMAGHLGHLTGCFMTREEQHKISEGGSL